MSTVSSCYLCVFADHVWATAGDVFQEGENWNVDVVLCHVVAQLSLEALQVDGVVVTVGLAILVQPG